MGKYPYDTEARSIIIKLDSGKSIKSESIHDILKDLRHTRDIPTGFEVEFKCGEAHFTMNLNSGINVYGDKLKYSVKCANDQYYKDVADIADSWLESVSANDAVRIWKKSGGWAVAVLMIVLGVILVISFASGYDEDDYYRAHLNSEIRSSIEAGVNDTTIYTAVELLLKLNSGYVPENYSVETQRFNTEYFHRNRFIFFASVILLIGFNLTPKTVIGLAGGKRRYRCWKLWIRLWTYTIPVLIVLPIILHFVL